MITLRISETELVELGEIVMVANTPYYLFDRLRSSGPVIGISQSHTSVELSDALYASLQAASQHEEAAVASYAIIVALSMKSDPEAMTTLAAAKVERLRWGTRLVEFAQKSFKPTSYSSVLASECREPVTAEESVSVSSYSS